MTPILSFSAVQKTCHMMANFSNYAYKDKEEAEPLFESRGYSNYEFVDKKGSQAHIVWNDEYIVLVFRGTQVTEIADIKADFNAWPDAGQSGGWVHNGFQNALDAIWAPILDILVDHTDKKIMICGHSLGAGMATIAASRLKNDNPMLFTFGSPRVGNKPFIDSFKDIIHYRFVNNNDIVTAVPMAFTGYRHHGQCMYIDYHGQIQQFSLWQRLKDKFRGRLRAWQKKQAFDGLHDHSCLYYCLYTSENKNGH